MKIFKETLRKYYKNSSDINVTINGSLNVSNGIVSGFSKHDYLILPVSFASPPKSFEFGVKIKTPSSWSNATEELGHSHAETIGFNGKDYEGIMLFIEYDTSKQVQQIRCRVGKGNKTWVGDDENASEVFLNTDYWIKGTWDGTTWKIYLSTDGTSYSQKLTIEHGFGLICMSWVLGNSFNSWFGEAYFTGSIDLNECYFKANNEFIWKGMKEKEVSSDDYDFFTDTKLYKVKASKKLNTNCITQIPNDVKLEYNGIGRIVVKAGSKFYIPNGFNTDGSKRFDEVIINRDLTPIGSADNRSYVLAYDVTHDQLWANWEEASTSGNSSSVPNDYYGYYYNTDDNTIYDYRGGVRDKKSSIPICIFFGSAEDNSISSVKLLNIISYVGGVAFGMPGVKCLIPNGRNEDGTNKCVEIETQNVCVPNIDGVSRNVQPLFLDQGYFYSDYYDCQSTGDNGYTPYKNIVSAPWRTYFDQEKNQMFHTSENDVYYNVLKTYIGYWTYSNGKISNLNIVSPKAKELPYFKAIKSYEKGQYRGN